MTCHKPDGTFAPKLHLMPRTRRRIRILKGAFPGAEVEIRVSCDDTNTMAVLSQAYLEAKRQVEK